MHIIPSRICFIPPECFLLSAASAQVDACPWAVFPPLPEIQFLKADIQGHDRACSLPRVASPTMPNPILPVLWLCSG